MPPHLLPRIALNRAPDDGNIDEFMFSHLSFQQYYCAQYVVRHLIQRAKILENTVRVPRIENTVQRPAPEGEDQSQGGSQGNNSAETLVVVPPSELAPDAVVDLQKNTDVLDDFIAHVHVGDGLLAKDSQYQEVAKMCAELLLSKPQVNGKRHFEYLVSLLLPQNEQVLNVHSNLDQTASVETLMSLLRGAPQITHLDLSHSGLAARSTKALARYMQQWELFSQLKVLNLAGCEICGGAEVLFTVLAKSKLTELNVSNCQLEPVCTRHLAHCVANIGDLSTLLIDSTGDISDQRSYKLSATRSVLQFKAGLPNVPVTAGAIVAREGRFGQVAPVKPNWRQGDVRVMW